MLLVDSYSHVVLCLILSLKRAHPTAAFPARCSVSWPEHQLISGGGSWRTAQRKDQRPGKRYVLLPIYEITTRRARCASAQSSGRNWRKPLAYALANSEMVARRERGRDRPFRSSPGPTFEACCAPVLGPLLCAQRSRTRRVQRGKERGGTHGQNSVLPLKTDLSYVFTVAAHRKKEGAITWEIVLIRVYTGTWRLVNNPT